MDFSDDINYEIVKKMDGTQLMETYIKLDLIRIAQFRQFPRLKAIVHLKK